MSWGLRTLTGALDGNNRVFVSDAVLTVPTTVLHLNGMETSDWTLGPDNKTITIGSGSPAPLQLEVYG